MATLSQGRVSPFTIVVGLKWNDGGSYAFQQAARLAAAIPSATLHLVHVFDEALAAKEAEQLKQHLNLYVNEMAESLGNVDLQSAVVHLRKGSPALAIVQLANDVEAQLIVLGSSKHLARFSGVPAEQVTAIARCPVLVAGPKPDDAVTAPTIEPPCADCVARRAATGGNEWWCARHAAHALAAHTFSYRRELPFSTHDSNLGPTGL